MRCRQNGFQTILVICAVRNKHNWKRWVGIAYYFLRVEVQSISRDFVQIIVCRERGIKILSQRKDFVEFWCVVSENDDLNTFAARGQNSPYWSILKPRIISRVELRQTMINIALFKLSCLANDLLIQKRLLWNPHIFSCSFLTFFEFHWWCNRPDIFFLKKWVNEIVNFLFLTGRNDEIVNFCECTFASPGGHLTKRWKVLCYSWLFFRCNGPYSEVWEFAHRCDHNRELCICQVVSESGIVRTIHLNNSVLVFRIVFLIMGVEWSK